MSLELLDSRRLTGPTLLWDEPGAAVEVSGPDAALDRAIEEWERRTPALLEALDWRPARIAVRRYPGGATLAIAAPVDVLYAACEVAEQAWEAARTAAPVDAETLATLRAAVAAEASPRSLALRAAAARRGVTYLWDDETVSVGLGKGSCSWPLDALPDVAEVDWGAVYDIPIALVTGTNGKTTTVRMLASIGRAAGLVAGNTSTDGVQVDGATVLEGDYTGPEGARALLRDRRVEIAFLETARGGMLRRGLPVFRADAALVTNVGTDHLGEWGITDLPALAAVKLVVARAVEAGGCLVLNQDDPHVMAAAAGYAGRHAGLTLAGTGSSPPAPVYTVRDERLARVEDGVEFLLPVTDIPACFGGAAIHNVQNALGAWAVADALRVPTEATRDGLRGFGSSVDENPGRANLYTFGRLRVLADFGHNPEGVERVMQLASSLADGRLCVLLGQAGDRQDESIRAMARAVGRQAPDRVVLKRMERYLRGRPPGEVLGLLHEGLDDANLPATARVEAPDEMAGARVALEWGGPGDLLVLLLHADRERVLALLDRLTETKWAPGQPLPLPEDRP